MNRGIELTNINEDYIEDYIRSITPKNNDNLIRLEQYAAENRVPIIEPEVAQFMKVILRNNKPKNILEIGTAIGYSALIMAEYTDEHAKITTIERRDDMVNLAKNNIKDSSYSDKIRIIKGEAEEVLLTLNESYDFIFLDAAKGQYLEFFKHCSKHLASGGMIMSDNVLFKGMVATDNLVERRKKTIVKRLRSFLQYINNIDGYISCVIPIGDGVALTYKEDRL